MLCPNGWWRDVFGQLGSGGTAPKEAATERHGHIPMNPGVKANEGVDKSAHDFLQSWVVGKQANKSVAYFSRRSYPCLEELAQKSTQPVPQGMIRLHTMMEMQKFSDSLGAVNSVADVFEPADKWLQASKPAKNAYASEFRLVSLPVDMGEDEECVHLLSQALRPSQEIEFGFSASLETNGMEPRDAQLRRSDEKVRDPAECAPTKTSSTVQRRSFFCRLTLW